MWRRCSNGPNKIRFNAFTFLSAIENEGYKFTEWRTDNDVTITKQKTLLSAIRLILNEDSDVYLSAVFTPNIYN